MTVQDTTFTGNLDVSQNAVIHDRLYLDAQKDVFFKGLNGKIGLNVTTPRATLDISTNIVSALNVKSSNVNNRNILARNIYNNGIALDVTGTTSASIQFYSDASGNVDASNNPNVDASNNPYAMIKYINESDQLIIDTVGDIKLASKVWITDRDTLGNIHINNETAVIYDTSNSTAPYFAYDAYDNANVKLGNALSLISANNQSVTQMNLTAPNKLGFQLGGGSYPNDNSRRLH